MTGAMSSERPNAWHVYFLNIYFDPGRTGGGQGEFKDNYAGKLFRVGNLTNIR